LLQVSMIPLRFDFVPYPLWRRRLPAPLPLLARTALRPFMPVDADTQPPQTARELAAYLVRWRLLPKGISAADAERALAADDAPIDRVPPDASSPPLRQPIRLPAQWQPMERILMTFPVLYPPLWDVHRQMIAAITPVADMTVIVPSAAWARAIRFYLGEPHPNPSPHTERGFQNRIQLDRVQFLQAPTDDIWIRDYGPFVGYDAAGERAVIDGQFDPLGAYPQARDDGFAAVWAAYRGLPSRRFEFHTEGGNYWSDGAGTLIVSDEMLARYPHMTARDIEARLCEAFAFDKLIMLPRLLREETGHIDLVCKLADETTVLINRPNGSLNDERLRQAAAMLRGETNAAGQPYRVIDLPFPSLYHNWFVYPVWRTYTNSLTVNGRVLVPIFGVGEDREALAIYRAAMPQYEIVPIDCRASANGGGAVHCLTKEVPAALG
jgi:agmatine deiminase